ncbi:unnamed protein product [Sphagnum troendelagicum]|uniref:Uncharacterized protein n=1 Tax=Sphagnum troendelagicum TaxID=128251 RepID=A0ABP0TX23_9BRYO
MLGSPLNRQSAYELAPVNAAATVTPFAAVATTTTEGRTDHGGGGGPRCARGREGGGERARVLHHLNPASTARTGGAAATPPRPLPLALSRASRWSRSAPTGPHRVQPRASRPSFIAVYIKPILRP